MGRPRIIAVDAVLVPPWDIIASAVAANRGLTDRCDGILLGEDENLPHISLAMGVLPQAKLDLVNDKLRCISEAAGSLSLTITGVAMITNASGVVISSWIIEKTPQLQQLHEKIMTSLHGYLENGVTGDMFAGKGAIAQSSIEWVKHYRRKSAFASFLPHVTLGFGKAAALERPIRFTAARLALCHLGNHCTCRKVLAEVSLGG